MKEEIGKKHGVVYYSDGTRGEYEPNKMSTPKPALPRAVNALKELLRAQSAYEQVSQTSTRPAIDKAAEELHNAIAEAEAIIKASETQP